ncbi:MAG: hypothetical protein PHS66_00155 [Candidatus Omnitrophica bacterium]|nr:hypothetical protein [Candidatus Omnitrophota bacterium]
MKYIIILWMVMISLCLGFVPVIAQPQEFNTSQGKVIVGLSREKAYQMFGAPVSRGDRLWYYSGTPGFFVSFSETPSILLYPDYYKATLDTPFEFKVYLIQPDLSVKEITKNVQLIFDRPGYIKLQGPGVIIPKIIGEYSMLAMYKGNLSNPLYMQVTESLEAVPEPEKVEERERLLSIDILPYRPLVPIEGSVDFVALGTFVDGDTNEYIVRDISQEVGWFMRQRPNLTWHRNENGNRLYFMNTGQVEVLSKYALRYKGIESFIQRAEVDRISLGLRRLRHILVLPETMTVSSGTNLNLRAFGTYDDNSVKEITKDVKWKIDDADILKQIKDGYFSVKSEGSVQVSAVKEGVESLSVRIIAVRKSPYFITPKPTVKPNTKIDQEKPRLEDKKNTSEPDKLEEIKESVEKLKKDLLIKKKELRSIQITPKQLEIGLGEESKFSASGVYSDGSVSDLTILGRWETLNRSVATVLGGNVSCVAEGETSAYVEFKGVRSEYVRIAVKGPRLVSLELRPESLIISRDGKANLKVQGNYYDHSQRDITPQVSWGIEGAQIVKIENGLVRPLKFGYSKIFAEYSGLKSNNASVDVVFTLSWLFWLLGKIIFSILLSVLCVVFVLYLLTENKRKQLQSLKSNPREFILKLYENASRLTVIFGQRYDSHVSPLIYAELVKNKFSMEGNNFMNFSIKFEEAKYSNHVLENSHVLSAVGDYNRFFEELFRKQGKLGLLHRYCLSLICRRPIFILSSKGSGGKQA